MGMGMEVEALSPEVLAVAVSMAAGVRSPQIVDFPILDLLVDRLLAGHTRDARTHPTTRITAAVEALEASAPIN